MKKAAATVSLVIGSLLLLAVCVSFGSAVYTAQQRMNVDYVKAQDEAIASGKEIVQPTDNTPGSATLLVMGVSGAAFLVAGLALWPKSPPPPPRPHVGRKL